MPFLVLFVIQVVLPWCPFGGWEYSRGDEATSPAVARNANLNRNQLTPTAGVTLTDWENFSIAQKGAVWMEGYVSGQESVRRRLWRRVYVDPASSPSIGASGMPRWGASMLP